MKKVDGGRGGSDRFGQVRLKGNNGKRANHSRAEGKL